MRLLVQVKTQARKTAVDKITDTDYRVTVTAAAIDNKANHAVIKALAEHFDIAPSLVTIIRGATSKIKYIEIPDYV